MTARPRHPQHEPRLESALARLDTLVDWERLRRDSAAVMRLSLEPMGDLCARLGSPERGIPVVHVAGTKGKGSTAALVAAGLQRGGLRTALYTSPHVERVTERLWIDGAEVDPTLLARAIDQALWAREAARAAGTSGGESTWFDLMTAASLWAARESGVDWIVAEVGLGGRLDSTNVLQGEVCVITQIELEHTAVLGPTRARIAAEKAGILERGASLVTGLDASDEAGAVIAARAAELDVPVLRPLPDGAYARATIEGRNRALARAVLDELGRLGRRDAGGRALRSDLLDDETATRARLPARMELSHARGVRVVLDGAHVPESVRDVLRDLAAGKEWTGPCTAIVGLGRDKALEAILKALRGRVDRLCATSVGTDLARPPEEIAAAARVIGIATETAANPREAFEQALAFAAREGGGRWLLVIGSLHLAGAIRPLLADESSPRDRC